jgi:hypothetical protein
VPGWQDIPAVAVTAEAEFMPAGTTFCDVWHKPLRVPTLLARLDRVIAPSTAPRRDAPAPDGAARAVAAFPRTSYA